MYRYRWRYRTPRLVISIVLPLALVGVGYALFSEELTVSGTATTVGTTMGPTLSNGDTDYSYSRWGGPSVWTHSFNPFEVTNTSLIAYVSWQVSFDIPADTTVGNHWNSTYTIQGSRITFKSVSHNGSVPPGGSESFGFTLTSSQADYTPTNIIVLGDDGVGSDLDYQAMSGLTVSAITNGNGWQQGSYRVRQYDIVVSNNTGSDLHGWRVNVEWDDSVNQLIGSWNVDYLEMPDQLRFSGQSTLGNGSSASFGAQLGLEDLSSSPEFTVVGRL